MVWKHVFQQQRLNSGEKFVCFKGCGAKKLIAEFPNEVWRLWALNKLLKSCEKLA